MISEASASFPLKDVYSPLSSLNSARILDKAHDGIVRWLPFPRKLCTQPVNILYAANLYVLKEKTANNEKNVIKNLVAISCRTDIVCLLAILDLNFNVSFELCFHLVAKEA